MPWARKWFKGGKVFARVDAGGELVVENGLVEIKYRENDSRSYSTRPDRLGDARGAPPPPSSGGRSTGGSRKRKAPSPSSSFTLRPGAIAVYTDGACTGNPGPAGIGAVLLWEDQRKEISEYLGHATNNIAELTAILRALEQIKNPSQAVDVCTDSEYAIGVLSRGWKAKANQTLIAEVKAEIARFSDLRLVKVPAHSGVPENERADELAREAITRTQ